MTQSEKIAASPRELTLSRSFTASRKLAFRMWTEQTHLAQWWGPRGFTNPVCEADARPGGTLRIVMRAPDGTTYRMIGEFREVVPPERVVFSNIALDPDGNHVLGGLTTVAFAERAGGTEMTLHTRATALVAEAETYIAGMDEGWRQSVERLAEYLAGAPR